MSDSRELSSKYFGTAAKWLMTVLAALAIALCGIAAPLDSDAQVAYAEDESLYLKDGSFCIPGVMVITPPQLAFDYTMDDGVSLAVGKGFKLKPHLLEETAYAKTLKWTSSKPSVVAVNQKGYIKAKKPGKAKITVKNKYLSSDYTKITVEVYKIPTKNKIYKKLMKLKKTKFPEGKQWGSEKHYFWKKANMHGYECAAFGAKVSDLLFGKTKPIKIHHSFKKMKIGDYIRIGGYHSVIVVTKAKNWITVAEGNYQGCVHWGRKITKAELKNEGFAVWTRY